MKPKQSAAIVRQNRYHDRLKSAGKKRLTCWMDGKAVERIKAAAIDANMSVGDWLEGVAEAKFKR